MQRLLSLTKLLSTSPRNLSNSTFLCQSLPLSEPHLSHCPSLRRTIVSHSWRSPSNCLSKFHPFLSNPVFVKHLSTNAVLKGPRKRMLDRGFQFFRAQFPRQNFSFKSAYDSRGWQSWIRRRLTSDGVVIGLILTNVAVFMLWQIADRQFMAKNFMIQLDNFKSGRVHTMITSAFSHIQVGHLISNMVGLYFFGMNIGRNFGPEFLLKLYLAGAFVGSAFYLVHHAFMASSSKNKRMWEVDRSQVPGLGASGAVNAIMLLDIFLFPKNTLYLEFIIPVPAILLGIFLIGNDLLRIIEGNSQISGSAHLGGAVVAALAWLRIRKGRF